MFIGAAGSNQTPYVNTSTAFSYNPSTNVLSVTSVKAQYADLAENYAADADYEPGTVMIFGGSNEITAASSFSDPSIAGVVSTDPAYLMNGSQIGNYVLQIALVGRVPCKVVGTIRKGDRLVSSDIPGVATKLDPASYQPGCMIGKALQDYDSANPGIIEVAVGRS